MIAIASISKNGVIGDKETGKMPWPKQRDDLSWFRQTTWGKNIIVGRKTYDNLPFLDNR